MSQPNEPKDSTAKVGSTLAVGHPRDEVPVLDPQSRFEDFVALLPQTVFETDLNGRIIFANRCAFEIFGYSIDDLEQGIYVTNLLIAKDRERAKRQFMTVLSGGTTGSSYTALRKNGSVFPIVIHSAPVFVNGNPVGLRGLIVDLTEQKLATERYQTIFEHSGNALLIIEADTKITTCNRAFEELAECSRSEIEGLLSWVDFVANPTLRSTLLNDNYQRHLAKLATKAAYEVTFISRHGTVRDTWVNVTTIPGSSQSLASFIDITERIQAAKTLQDSENLYRAVFENTDNATILIEDDTTILFANSKWVRLSQYTKEELEGKMRWTQFIVAEDVERMIAYQRAGPLSESTAPSALEFRFQRRDGTILDVVCHLAVIPGTKRRIASLTDVTASKRAEIERNQLQARLSQAEKLEAIGQLAGGVAHDFNNQLSAILGYAELLESSVEDPELKEYAHLIAKASLRSADLTKQLLAFARKGKLLSVPVDLHKILADVVSLLKRSIDRRITIIEHRDAQPSIIVGDPSQLQSAFTNLALNARDAMPDGGELTFSTTLQRLDLNYCREQPYDISPGRFIRIDVQDTGTGMDAETRRRLFEPFFTTKVQGKGTGLGLASVYGTIKQHRGAIHVYSEIGKGSCFSVFLPLSGQPSAPASVIPTSRALSYSGRVLVVDDESVVARGIAASLEKLGLSVDICHDGVEAVAFFAEHWPKVDLVIVDLVMPKMGGKDTFRALRLQNPNVKVIVASGFSVEGEAQQLLDEGALGFLQKPFQATALAELVGQVLKLK